MTAVMHRDGKAQVLVATDVAARGLDIPSVDLVCHYDVPLDCESFLHRSGARAALFPFLFGIICGD